MAEENHQARQMGNSHPTLTLIQGGKVRGGTISMDEERVEGINYAIVACLSGCIVFWIGVIIGVSYLLGMLG